MNDATWAIFMRCVNIERAEGRLDISCKLGNWGVSGPEDGSIMSEAGHYWAQYYRDGEYDELLKEAQ